MFAINGTEALLSALWLIGLVCAVASYSQGRRGLGGAALIAAAVVVPVLGSLLAVAVFVMQRLFVMHMRGRVHRGDHPVTG
jgi:L-cystine uptake protein TcyP (sodium:dicarboxylate symporter family)